MHHRCFLESPQDVVTAYTNHRVVLSEKKECSCDVYENTMPKVRLRMRTPLASTTYSLVKS